MPSWSRSIGKKGDSFYFSWPKSEHYSPPPSFHIISPKSSLKRKMFFLKMSPDFSQCLRVYQSKLQMYSTVGYVGVSGTSTCIFSGVDFVFWFFYRMIWYTVRTSNIQCLSVCIGFLPESVIRLRIHLNMICSTWLRFFKFSFNCVTLNLL
jgi:hypothetical protein